MSGSKELPKGLPKLMEDEKRFTQIFFTDDGKFEVPSMNFIVECDAHEQMVVHWVYQRYQAIQDEVAASSEFKTQAEKMNEKEARNYLSIKVNQSMVAQRDNMFNSLRTKKWRQKDADATETWVELVKNAKEASERSSSSEVKVTEEEEEEFTPKSDEEGSEAEGEGGGTVDQGDEAVVEEEEAVPVGAVFSVVGLKKMTLDDLISTLADGLEYDKFEATKMREILQASKIHPKELVTLLTAYIYVGNNPVKLTSKVKVEAVGKAALTVANKYKVIRKKVNSKSLTLARIAIAYSPAVYAIRTRLEALNKLPTSGINTTTPLVLQDVALGGVSNKIQGGDGIKDFLVKFNRALMKFAEAKSSEKSKESEMDATAEKYLDLSLQGAKQDRLVQEWDFNANRGVEGLTAFLNKVLPQ